MTWTAYHRSTDIMDYLDYLAATYPDLCSVLTIGHTIEHRPLKMLRIANGATGNSAVWIDGGLHAREWVSPASVTFIIAQFVEDWEKQPVFVRSIDWWEYDIYIVEPYIQISSFFNIQVLSSVGQSRWVRVFAHDRSIVAQKPKCRHNWSMYRRRFESQLWLSLGRQGFVAFAM